MNQTYLQYGVSSDLANKLESLGLPKTTFATTSSKNLREKYGLPKDEIALVKSLIKRVPIEADVVEKLLESSNYVCCVCKGVKGSSYIIHHIEEYSVNQNNEYYNLAVLCPNDHDLAHQNGKSLTLRLTAEQIKKAKAKWESKVTDLNIERASKGGNILEIDFINIPRIIELLREIFHAIPSTDYTQSLLRAKLITADGGLNMQTISSYNKSPRTPLIFFGPHGSSMLRFHYYDLFKKVLSALNFKDLDSLLNKKSIKSGIEGEYCYYVGGLYSQKTPEQIANDSSPIKFHFRRKPFSISWLVDPQFFCSSSARFRAGEKTLYMIYGRIRTVRPTKIDGKGIIEIDIRPYVFGLPNLTKHRTPDIAYQKMYDEMFEEEDE